MKKMMIIALLALMAAPLQAADKPLTDEQKTLYVIGTNVAQSLSAFYLTPAEFEIVLQGLKDAQAGKKPDFDVPTYNLQMLELAKERRKAFGEKQAAAGKEYLEKAAKEKNAVKTTSGMLYFPITEGKGDSPKPTDDVKVNYRGTLIDGREFDSSYKRGNPLEFNISKVIPCWVEGLQKMKQGGKARLVCPSNLAYGENGAGQLIPPGATLDFEVELLEVKPPAPAAETANAAPAKPAEPAKK